MSELYHIDLVSLHLVFTNCFLFAHFTLLQEIISGVLVQDKALEAFVE